MVVITPRSKRRPKNVCSPVPPRRFPISAAERRRGLLPFGRHSRPACMLQGALVGLAAKAKAASAKVGDVVGDFLDNSVDNPLYEDDEDAEWSEEVGMKI